MTKDVEIASFECLGVLDSLLQQKSLRLATSYQTTNIAAYGKQKVRVGQSKVIPTCSLCRSTDSRKSCRLSSSRAVASCWRPYTSEGQVKVKQDNVKVGDCHDLKL